MARYNVNSNYPTSVDDLLCLSDVDLEHLSQSNYHNQLAMSGQYTDAGNYLENTATFDSMCASLFNMLENRIYAVQAYLKNYHSQWYDEYGVESPFVFGAEPSEKEKTPIWTE